MSYDRPDYSPAYIPLPYDMAYYPRFDNNLADNTETILIFNAALWGAGRDCYLFGITIEARDTLPFATLYHEGLRIRLWTGIEYFFMKTYRPTPILDTGLWRWLTTEYFVTPYKLLSTDALNIGISNACGINMDMVACNMIYLAI